MSDYYIHGDRFDSIHFNNMAEVMNFKYPNKYNEQEVEELDLYTRRPEWYGDGCRTKEDAIHQAIYGNQNLLTLLTEMGNKLEDVSGIDGIDHSIVKRKRKSKWRNQGDEIDIHKVYNGNLDRAWRKMVKIEMDKTHKHVVLLIDTGGNSMVKQSDTLWRAAVAVKIANDLISAGKAVKIIVGGSVSDLVRNGNIVTTTVTVKDYNEPLSLERLACMSHIGFHRSVIFMARAAHPDKIKSSFGSTSRSIETYPPLHIEEEGDTVKYVYIGQLVSKQGALTNIEKINSTWSK